MLLLAIHIQSALDARFVAVLIKINQARQAAVHLLQDQVFAYAQKVARVITAYGAQTSVQLLWATAAADCH
jgi:hypothetical protein